MTARTWILAGLILLVGTLPFALAGCGDEGGAAADGDRESVAEDPEEEEEPLRPVPELIQEGKDRLSEDLYGPAIDSFNRALAQEPENPDALFGLCLGQLEHWFAIIDMGITMLKDNNQDNSDLKRKIRAASYDDIEKEPLMTPFIEKILSDFVWQAEAQIAHIEKLKELDEAGKLDDFLFDLDHFRVNLNGKTFMDLRSEWDRSDVYVMSALQYTILASLRLVDSQDWKGYLEKYYPALLDGGLPGSTEEGVEEAAGMLPIMIRLLAENPSFLTIKAEGGETRWNDAGQALQRAVSDALHAAELMEAETDDQSNDVCVRNDNLTVRGVKHFALHGAFNTGVSEVLLLWEGEELSMKTTLSLFKTHLAGQPTMRIRMGEDMIMLMGVLVDFINKAFGIRDLLTLFGAELDETLIRMIESLLKARTGEDVPKNILTAAGSFLPHQGIQLDFMTFFSRPMDFREFLPNLGENPFTPEREPVVLYSYECARLGFPEASYADGGTLPVWLHDRGPMADKTEGTGNDTASVRALVRIPAETEEGAPTVVDDETFTLAESSLAKGLFSGEIPTNAGAPVMGDGALGWPEGATVLLIYEDGNGEEPIEVTAEILADGSTEAVFSYAMQCLPDTSRDYDHFTDDQPEFAQAYLIPDPPAPATLHEPYPSIAADTVAGSSGYRPFKSPSFNGILWLDMAKVLKIRDEAELTGYGYTPGFVRSDARTTNAFMQSMAGSAGGMGGM